MRKLFSVVFVFAIMAGLAYGQTAMTSTTLSAAVSTDRTGYVNVASATGISAPSGSVIQTVLFIDREAMDVQSVSGTRIVVRRGTRGTSATAHGSGSTVFVGSPSQFYQSEPVLTTPCTSTNEVVLPRVVIPTGNVFHCVSSKWVSVANVTAKATTEFVAVTGTTGTTLTNVVGMAVPVVPGTYRFVINIPGVTTTNAGVKYAIKQNNSATLTSIEAIIRAYAAAAVAVTHSTTATDAAVLLDSAAAVINTTIEGTMVVATGGTLQLQAAQKTAHADEQKVYVGASMTFTKI